MIALLRNFLRWAVRHFVIFALVLLALWAAARVYEAYRAVPALRQEVAALEAQKALLEEMLAGQRAEAARAAARIGQMERPALQRRLAEVRAEIAAVGDSGPGAPSFALEVVRGDTSAIARQLMAAFRLQLLQREQATIEARLRTLEQGNRVRGLSDHVRRLDARAASLRATIAEIEQRHPLLSRAENVPLVRNLEGPWRDLIAAREELRAIEAQRAQAVRALEAGEAARRAMASAEQRLRAAMPDAPAPDSALENMIEERQTALSGHWGSRLWNAVEPLLGWALWITILVIVVPPATKAFWFFLVAPHASRLRPIVVRPDLAAPVGWARPRDPGEAQSPGSGVSRRIVLMPGEELIVRPEYLQSSMNEAMIDSVVVLSRAIPFGSLATGLVGLTRIRVRKREIATVSATEDPLDEVGLIDIPEGGGLIFKPRALIGVVQPTGQPVRIRSAWRLGHLSAWMTLQLRFLVFEGPCTLLVKGTRGIALETSENGRRIAGAATLGWSPGLAYSVRRSETFLAYLTGKQSLFNDSFEGRGGIVVYEEVPRAGVRGGLLGRGLEGLGEGLLKVIGL